MKKDNSDIIINYLESIPDYLILDDLNSIKETGVNLKINKRENSIWAAIEWTIPTAIAAYILKPYFETFLKEAGKQHYKVLTKKLKTLLEKGKLFNFRTITASQSTDKISKSYTQSKTISLLIETRNGRFIKLLFDDELEIDDWENAIDQLFNFIIENYETPKSNKLDEITKSYDEKIHRNYYAIINKKTKNIEIFDEKGMINRINR